MTQKIKKKNFLMFSCLECTQTKKSVIQRMNHLKEVCSYYCTTPPSIKNRVIILSSDLYTAYQAAGAILSLRSDSDSNTDEDVRMFDDDWFDNDEMIGGSSDNCSQDEEYLILDDLYFEKIDLSPGNEKKLLFMEEQKKYLSTSDNLFIEWNRKIERDHFVDMLEEIKIENIVIRMPKEHYDRELIYRLQFEQGYVLLSVNKPDDKYYEALISDYLEGNGWSFPENITSSYLLEKLKKFRKEYFHEADIFRYVDRAVEVAEDRKDTVLRREDFDFHVLREQSSEQLLKEMIGLENVKKQVERLCALQVIQNERKQDDHPLWHYNIAFSGEPGTGKSEVARLYSKILEENGISNGRFVQAKRSDIIGKYLGHTAPKINDLFEKTRGGVLFIDEAGSFTGKDEYTREAITEFVRHMEENPETTVIFATYPDQTEAFINQDPGLASRIKKVLRFESYSNKELCLIFDYMLKKRGYEAEKGWEMTVVKYLEMLRKHAGEKFGNAREVRKLLELSMEISCARVMRERKAGKKSMPCILISDIDQVIQEVAPEEPPVRRIGFWYEDPSVQEGVGVCGCE